MRNLIFLFVRYGGIGLFFLLEGICLYMVVNYNQQQKEIWLNSSSLISGMLYDVRDNAVQYYYLSSNADSLLAENARLKAQLKNAKFVTDVLKDTVTNETTKQNYIYIGAKIINSTINRHNNTMTLNRGEKHGIHPNMGVIDARSSGGLVGIIRNTSAHYSQMMPILHQESRVPASIKGSNYHGFLSWPPGNSRKVQLIDVPKHAAVGAKDTIQTSEYSGLFPEGIPVAIIDSVFQKAGSNFHTIEATLINDLANARYVYVVDNLMKVEEDESIDEEQENEE